MLGVREDARHRRSQGRLLVTHQRGDPEVQIRDRLQEFNEGGFILAVEPATAQRPARAQFAHHP